MIRIGARPVHMRWRVAATAALAILALVTAFAWGSGGSHAFSVSTNQDDTYRAEFYFASRWQRVLHWSMDDPGYVRLYSNVDGHLVATSQVVDFFGGSNADIIWLMAETGQVIIGRDVIFSHVHPVTRWGEVLPIRHEIEPGGDIRAPRWRPQAPVASR